MSDPVQIEVRPGSEAGSWLVTSRSGDDIQLVDPTHETYQEKDRLLAFGSRIHEGHLDERYELLCFKDGVVYLCRRTASDRWTVPVAVFDGDTYSPDMESVDAVADLAETELFAQEEREDIEWSMFLVDRQQERCTWEQFAIDGEVVRVPSKSNPLFDQLMAMVDSASSAGSGYGPMTNEYSEGIYQFDGHEFVVAGDEIEPYNPTDDLRDGWIHPLSMMVDDGRGNGISIGFDEDDEFFEELFWDDEDDEIESGDWEDPDPETLEVHQVKVRARDNLENLQITHHDVDLVGPSASSTLPSGNSWVAFTTDASLDELEEKLFRAQRVMVNGWEGLMSDDLSLTVALRLSDEDHVYRLSHDWVEVADRNLEALVARRFRK